MNAERKPVILAEDVKLVLNPNPTYIVKDNNGRDYVTYSERDARAAMATHVTCLGCNDVIEKIHGAYCPSCLLFLQLNEAEEFDGTYPVFIGDKFLASEDELIAYAAEEKLDLRRTLLQSVHPNYPFDVNVTAIESLFEDMLFEDNVLPDPVHEACVDFQNALAKIREPISWTAYDNLRLSDEQIAVYIAKIKTYKENHAEKAQF